MTQAQWQTLTDVIKDKVLDKIPYGFIIDSPWLPNWYGISILDYFSNDELWLKANLKANETFKDVIFLPGFWSEYGMCTEPSAFGAKCIFQKNEFPFAQKIITKPEDINNITVPNVATDGLLPFMINRLVQTRKEIEKAGHQIKFSVSRGPLNIASFLMGTTELMMAMMTDRERVHKLLRIITDFLIAWHKLQRETFDTIDGTLLLDDIVGFISEADFMEMGFPYIKEIYEAQNTTVNFFHNDADCRASIKHYPDMGVNIYNPGIYMKLKDMKEVTDNRLTILGCVPPRDVLAQGSFEDIQASVKSQFADVADRSRTIISCAGGMPPGVTSENINTLIEAPID